MSNIVKAQEALETLSLELKEQVPQLKFDTDLGVSPITGKYLLILTYEIDPKLQDAVLRTPTIYNGFELMVQKRRGKEHER